MSNADAIRELIVERLRHYRDSGLGDTPHQIAVSETSEIASATALLDEARMLRAAFEKTRAIRRSE